LTLTKRLSINAAKFVEMAKEVRSKCRSRSNNLTQSCKGCVFSIKVSSAVHDGVDYYCMMQGSYPMDWELDDAWGTK
jgi:hypothetical protein